MSISLGSGERKGCGAALGRRSGDGARSGDGRRARAPAVWRRCRAAGPPPEAAAAAAARPGAVAGARRCRLDRRRVHLEGALADAAARWILVHPGKCRAASAPARVVVHRGRTVPASRAIGSAIWARAGQAARARRPAPARPPSGPGRRTGAARSAGDPVGRGHEPRAGKPAGIVRPMSSPDRRSLRRPASPPCSSVLRSRASPRLKLADGLARRPGRASAIRGRRGAMAGWTVRCNRPRRSCRHVGLDHIERMFFTRIKVSWIERRAEPGRRPGPPEAPAPLRRRGEAQSGSLHRLHRGSRPGRRSWRMSTWSRFRVCAPQTGGHPSVRT